MRTINEITADIIDAAIQIHRQFGPCMYEKAYELLLQVVRRDGITPEMAEQFYEHCSGTQEQEMDWVSTVASPGVIVGLKGESGGSREMFEAGCGQR